MFFHQFSEKKIFSSASCGAVRVETGYKTRILPSSSASIRSVQLSLACVSWWDSSHGFDTRVHGFATGSKALAREIPSATQAKLSHPSPLADVAGTRLLRQVQRKQNMADETKEVKSTEMSPAVMKQVLSRPGSISPALTHFSGALMELDEYR